MWDQYAAQFEQYVADHPGQVTIIAFTLARVKTFEGITSPNNFNFTIILLTFIHMHRSINVGVVQLTNSFNATKMFLNPQISEAEDLRRWYHLAISLYFI